MVEFGQKIKPKRWSVKTGYFLWRDSQLILATAIIKKKKIAKTSNDTLKKKEKKSDPLRCRIF